LGFSGAAAVIENGVTGYIGIGTGRVDSTEANAEFYVPAVGDIENLHVYVASNASNQNGNTITLRKNGVPTALTVSYDAGETGLKTDMTNLFGVVVGDRLSIQAHNAATGGGFKDITIATITFEVA
jgi:hypothetical protein